MSSQPASVARVAVVVPAWNTLGYLRRCLATVADQDVASESMVVDNGSDDGTSQWLRRAGVAHRALVENVGFAAAVNLGASLTHAPYVLVLNADCVLEDGCLRELLVALEGDPDLGGVQPAIVQDAAPGEPEWVYSRGQCLTHSGFAYEAGWGEPADTLASATCETFGVSGAACLLRRELFDDLGGYREWYFAFYEDVELNARARLAGWRFACVGAARARHVGHAAWRQHPDARAFNARLTTRNRTATAIEVLPWWGVLGMVAVSPRWLSSSVYHRTTRATLAGVGGAARQLPALWRARRQVRGRGSPQTLDRWLTRRSTRNPMLATVVPAGARSGRARDALRYAVARLSGRG